MKFQIKNRFNGELIFSIETTSGKLAVEAAIKAKANLSEADLSEANLWRANLSEADLSEANLSRANLSEANLSEADLSEADLSRANLGRANLSEANLSEADLSVIRNDFWSVLLFAQNEIQGLRKSLIDGKVNGSAYQGECACLVGTIANVRKCNYKELTGNLAANSERPAERFFLAIWQGDTPENNQFSKIAVEWIDEFCEAIQNKK